MNCPAVAGVSEQNLGWPFSSTEFLARHGQPLFGQVSHPLTNATLDLDLSQLSTSTTPVNNHAAAVIPTEFGPPTVTALDRHVLLPVFICPLGCSGPSRRTRSHRRANIPTSTADLACVMESPDGRFFCSQIGCDASYSRVGDCRRHLKTHNGPFFICRESDCDMQFPRRDKLFAHLKQGHRMGDGEARAAADIRRRQKRA